MPNKISLQQFFNSDMRVTSFKEFKDKIVIKIKSKNSFAHFAEMSQDTIKQHMSVLSMIYRYSANPSN